MRTLSDALNSVASGEIKLDGNKLKIDNGDVQLTVWLTFSRFFANNQVRDWAEVYRNAANNLGYDDFEAVAILAASLTTKEKDELLKFLSDEHENQNF